MITTIKKYIPTLFKTFLILLKVLSIIIIFTIIGYISNIISNKKCNNIIENYILSSLNDCNDGRQKHFKLYNDYCRINNIKPKYSLSVPLKLTKYDIHWISSLIESNSTIITTIKIFGYELNAPWFIQYKMFNSNEPGSLPWAYYHSHKWEMPFIIKEYYGYMYEDLYGGGGVKFYICILGLVYEVYNKKIWIS